MAQQKLSSKYDQTRLVEIAKFIFLNQIEFKANIIIAANIKNQRKLCHLVYESLTIIKHRQKC